MQKKKVCILQNGLARGGTDTFVVNLCRAIDKTQFEITVVNPSTNPDSLVREKDVLETGAKIIHTSDLGLGVVSKLRHFKKLYQVLKYGKFDVFQTNIDLFNGPNLFVAWLAGVPIRCCHSHNAMQQKSLVEGMTLPIRAYQSMMRWLCWNFSNRRCGCSTLANDFLYKGHNWHQENYPAIINNGIDIDRMRQPIDVDKKKEELGLTAKYNIVTVGRIIPQKNPLFIAEVFSELCKVRSDCNFVWVGTGYIKEQCEDILSANGVLDRVHFLGSRNDVSEILQCCNLFLMPSAFEGLGIVLIEAQATGLPCIVSDVIPKEANCGACEFIPLDKPIDIWVQQIQDVLDGRTQLSVSEDKIKKFTIEHMAMQMQKVFE